MILPHGYQCIIKNGSIEINKMSKIEDPFYFSYHMSLKKTKNILS